MVRVKRILLLLAINAAFICTISCANVKGYERVYLNDEDMELNMNKCAHFESYFQIIREGASGANGGKTGGGCGCN